MTANATPTFPLDLSAFRPLALDPRVEMLTDEQRATLRANIALCRDAIVFFTAYAEAVGLGGHGGGAYDVVPEALIGLGFVRHGETAGGPPVYPVFFDEAGHRVALQYLLAVLAGDLPAERLLVYRAYQAHMPGHPERGFTPGVHFSSGRLGHMWPFVNGVAMANPGTAVLLLGSDGAQMEGNDAEAARLAVAQRLDVKLLIDDNDVTITGHPSEYMPGFDVAQTLAGHGLPVDTGDGEDLDALYGRMARAVTRRGPVALINRRPMCPGIPGLVGKTKGHGPIPPADAIAYLEERGHDAAVAMLKGAQKLGGGPTHRGSGPAKGSNRDLFGLIVNELLDGMSPEERVSSVRVFDNDLEGSCGLHHIRKAHPEVFVAAGIMERGNFSAAAGFGYDAEKQGIFATFAAFLEMCISEITMARLNQANVLAHFSHSGCDDMADNTCHFGINNLFADGGLSNEGTDTTRLYFPADRHQFRACLLRIFNDPGLRFLFSTRSACPDILDEAGERFFGDDYAFVPGRDDLVREGTQGYVVSFGETLYRALDAVLTLRDEGIDVGLVNKATLNLWDPEMMKRLAAAPYVLVAEAQNHKTGLGSRFGSALLQYGFTGVYEHIGVHLEGSGGLWQQMPYQGLGSDGIANTVRRRRT
jgi:transketolase